jgi:hypothetical protein
VPEGIQSAIRTSRYFDWNEWWLDVHWQPDGRPILSAFRQNAQHLAAIRAYGALAVVVIQGSYIFEVQIGTRRRLMRLLCGGGADALSGLFDKRYDSAGLGHIDGVAALDLGDCSARPLGHRALGNRRNHLVLGDHQVPARLGLPRGCVAKFVALRSTMLKQNVQQIADPSLLRS